MGAAFSQLSLGECCVAGVESSIPQNRRAAGGLKTRRQPHSPKIKREKAGAYFTLAQVSRSETARLKTNLSDCESLSKQKYPVRSN